MSFPVVYEPAAKAMKGPQPGASALMAWAVHNFPPGTNLGVFNPRSVRGGKALSLHAEGRAIDVGFPQVRPQGHPVGWRLANTLVDHHASVGVQCVIFARKIWSNQKAAQGWRPYTGTADHFDHVHAELTRQAARELTVAMIDSVIRRPDTPLPPGVVMPTPATGTWSLCDTGSVRATVAALYAIHRNTSLDANDGEVNQWMANDLIPRLAAGQSPEPTINHLNGALAAE